MLESLSVKSHDVAKVLNLQKSLATDLAINVTENLAENASQHHQHLSDEALMMAYAQGNVAAFESLYVRHKDPLLRYFLRQVNGREFAEELCQETWQSIIKASDNYQSSAKFTTYLYHVARNGLIDHYRKKGRKWDQEQSLSGDELEHFEPVGHSDDEPEQQMDKAQKQRLFIWALSELPAAQREVLVLKYENGMTVAEIAETIGDNNEAVKSRLRYAVNKLKQLMSQPQFEAQL